jgi:hypothetical protein
MRKIDIQCEWISSLWRKMISSLEQVVEPSEILGNEPGFLLSHRLTQQKNSTEYHEHPGKFLNN